MVHQVTLPVCLETARRSQEHVRAQAKIVRLVEKRACILVRRTARPTKCVFFLLARSCACTALGQVQGEGMIKRTLKHLSRVSDVFFRNLRIERDITVFPDDVFLTSYPRSGNTWTRFLVGNLIYQDEPVSFANVESRIPEIYFNSDHSMRSLPRPRILKSHESFQPQYPRVIYIVRDPRDVAVSFYHHNLKAGNIPDDYPMESFVPRFIAAEFDSKWGSWSDNVL